MDIGAVYPQIEFGGSPEALETLGVAIDHGNAAPRPVRSRPWRKA